MDPERDPIDLWLGHLDFAAELSAEQERNRDRMRSLLLSFIEVLDSFQRFFTAVDGPAEPPYLPTVRLIASQLEAALGGAGVRPVASLGLAVEPGRHEIRGVRSVPGVAGDTVVEELLRGYEWDGELLRKPRVIVAKEE
jgi:molecular chaperone GrpE (heat shock protein)